MYNLMNGANRYIKINCQILHGGVPSQPYEQNQNLGTTKAIRSVHSVLRYSISRQFLSSHNIFCKKLISLDFANPISFCDQKYYRDKKFDQGYL